MDYFHFRDEEDRSMVERILSFEGWRNLCTDSLAVFIHRSRVRDAFLRIVDLRNAFLRAQAKALQTVAEMYRPDAQGSFPANIPDPPVEVANVDDLLILLDRVGLKPQHFRNPDRALSQLLLESRTVGTLVSAVLSGE